VGFSGRFMRACFVFGGGGVVCVASLGCMWNVGGGWVLLTGGSFRVFIYHSVQS